MTVEAVRTGVVGSDNLSAGSVTTPAIAAGAVTVDKLRVGATGNLCPDPSFETGHVERSITQLGIAWASIDGGGNQSARALRIETVGANLRVWSYDPFPINPGEQFWMATDVKCSPDWSGAGIPMALAWQGSDGKTISRSSLPSPEALKGGEWGRISGIVRAPASAARAALQLDAGSAPAGAVWFDNVECRAVLSSATAGERAELSPDGVRLFDQDGEQVVSLVTGEPNYLTLSSQGRSVASISEEGRAGFQSVAMAEDLTWRGDSLSTHLDRLPRGIQAINTQLAADVTSAMGVEMGWVELACTIQAPGMYRIVVDTYLDPALDGGEVVVFLRDGGTGEPTLQSRQLQSHITPIKGTGWHRARLELTCPGTYLGAGTHRLLSTFLSRWGPTGQTVRLFGSDGYPSVMYVEDIGPALPSTGGLNPAGASQPLPKPPPTRYTKTYAAAWSGSYANRGSYNSYYGSQLVQGYYSSTNGTQAALVGFPAALANDLAGARIESVQLYLYFEHWYANSGGRAVIKAHGHSSRPTSFSSDGASMSVSWGRNEGKWIDISTIFDETRWRGIALDPASTSATYYGRARGVGQANPPQLKVTYTK